MIIVDKILETARKEGATDVYLITGKVPRGKVNGRVVRLNYPKLLEEDIEKIALNIMNEIERKKLREFGEVTFTYEVHESGRYRVNIFKQNENISCSIRCVNNKLDDVNVSDVCEGIVDNNGGLIVVAGKSGSGKTTTMSAIVEYINRNYAYNVVTLESPVEYVYEEEKCIIIQRNIGEDIASYDMAVDNSLKMNCDVMVIGELCDKTVIKSAIRAAQAGVLVISTMNCASLDMVNDTLFREFSKEEREDLQKVIKEVIFQTAVYNESENVLEYGCRKG